eukprot:363756-Chlamydomonas_euryale.AAC.11
MHDTRLACCLCARPSAAHTVHAARDIWQRALPQQQAPLQGMNAHPASATLPTRCMRLATSGSGRFHSSNPPFKA